MARPSPMELITKFKDVLPNAFPNGLKPAIEKASDLVDDVAEQVTLGNTKVTKEEFEEAKRVLKLTAVANIAQRKHAMDELMDEEEFIRTSEAEVKEAEEQVDSLLDNLVATGVVKIEERDPAKENYLYKQVMEQEKQKKEDQKSSGLVSKTHKQGNMEKKPAEGATLVDIFGIENLHKLKQVEKRPDLLPGGKGYEFNQKEKKKEREQKAMARRWRQDERPTGRVTSQDVLENKEAVVNEIFSAYDHDQDNTLDLGEFNELQADTDGPDSVNTMEEFQELLSQVGSGSKEKLHFVTFHNLYLDPWLSERFETILPVDYHSLIEAGKVTGEAMAELWQDQDEYEKVAKMVEPLMKEDMEEEQRKLEAGEEITQVL